MPRNLQAAFPEAKGFSVSNLWFMKKWYLFYAGSIEKLQQLVREIQHTEFPPIFALVPWWHHVVIISKCQSLDEALFYVVNIVSEGWSRKTTSR